jgi:hypothetical protein
MRTVKVRAAGNWLHLQCSSSQGQQNQSGSDRAGRVENQSARMDSGVGGKINIIPRSTKAFPLNIPRFGLC